MIHNRLTSKATAQTLLAYILLFLMGLTVAGCDGHKIVSKDKGDKTTKKNDAAPAATQNKDDPNALYHFNKWQKEPMGALSQPSISTALVVFKAKPTEQSASLDYYGEPATSYVFHGDKLEYLRLIDSPKALEINWLRPDEGDMPESKKVSQEHTRKVYNYARAIMGQAGGDLIKTMVESGDTQDADAASSPSNLVAGREIIMARCDFFDCRLIVKK